MFAGPQPTVSTRNCAQWAFRLGACCSLALPACSEDLFGLTDVATPLAQVRVQVAAPTTWSTTAKAAQAAGRLRAAVVWAEVPRPDPFCTKHAHRLAGIGVPAPADPTEVAVAVAGCRSDFAFVPARSGPSAPVAADGTAHIDFTALPPAQVLVGAPNARIGYAAIVVFVDNDFNGKLWLHRSNNVEFQQHLNGGPGGSEDGQEQSGYDSDEERFFWPGDVMPEPDRVLGTSFLSMLLPNGRIAYREGGFDAAAQFYPMHGCTAPLQGFSQIAVTGAWTAANCAAQSLGAEPLTVTLTGGQDSNSLACRAESTHYFDPAEDHAPKWETAFACLDSGEFVMAHPKSICKGLSHFELKDCRGDGGCSDPQWDYSAKPPSWWPCAHAPAKVVPKK